MPTARRTRCKPSLLAALAGAVLLSSAPPAAAQLGSGEINLDRITLAPMLAKSLPAVVSIRVKGLQTAEQNPLYNHPQFGRYLEEVSGRQPEQKAFQSSGSGVVVDPSRGLILTNFHVIEAAKEIKVHFLDGREFEGKLLGRDAATDVAAVQVEARDIVGLPIGRSLDVRVGDFVVAIGNPFGLEATATLGMVSSLKRTNVRYREFESYIQHDAAVNSGNSGGALVNLKGELVGLNTAILSPSGGSVGLGFAIPSTIAIHVMEQLVKHGRVRRGSSGVRTVDLTADKARALGLNVYKGAVIASVQKGSPAEQAGAQVDDVIVAVILADGTRIPIGSSAELEAGEGITEIGSKVTVEGVRKGVVYKAQMTIGDYKREPERLAVPESIVRLAGVVVKSLEVDSPVFGEVKGVEVAEVRSGTLAQLVGLLAGDVITTIDGERVRRPDDVVRLAKERNTKFDMRVMRNGVPVLVKFPL